MIFNLSRKNSWGFIFCDDTGAGIVRFQRIYRIKDKNEVEVYDLDFDGLAYTVVGTESLCSELSSTFEASLIDPSFTVTGGSGSTTSGLYAVEFFNTGITGADVGGETLPAGEKVKFEGYLDLVTNEFKRIDSINYDAGLSTLLIIETP